jgi:hypothetical protein
MFRLQEVSRISGARSFRDIGPVTKCVAVVLNFSFIGGVIAPLVRGILYLWGQAAVSPRERDDMLAAPFEGLIAMTFLALLLTPFFGAEFYSAVWSPFRWCVHGLQSLVRVGPAFGTYIVRRWSWPVLVRMAMGLEGYEYRRPVVTQVPSNLLERLVKYENMPEGAEKLALEKREAWIVRHLGDVSQTFSNLAVTAADINLLLRAIAEDKTLVHAAYYTDDECIARIAEWIAGGT